MLLKQLDINSGLCNGTTSKILEINHKVLRVQITNGSHLGSTGPIPRINVIPSETISPFRIKRLQFPRRLCYAMAINKAQGQCINNLGVYLPQPLFSHGQ